MASRKSISGNSSITNSSRIPYAPRPTTRDRNICRQRVRVRGQRGGGDSHREDVRVAHRAGLEPVHQARIGRSPHMQRFSRKYQRDRRRSRHFHPRVQSVLEHASVGPPHQRRRRRGPLLQTYGDGSHGQVLVQRRGEAGQALGAITKTQIGASVCTTRMALSCTEVDSDTTPSCKHRSASAALVREDDADPPSARRTSRSLHEKKRTRSRTCATRRRKMERAAHSPSDRMARSCDATATAALGPTAFECTGRSMAVREEACSQHAARPWSHGHQATRPSSHAVAIGSRVGPQHTRTTQAAASSRMT